MMAESKVSALSRTISYISLEIIPAGRPFLGFTAETHMRRQSQPLQKRPTVFIEILYDLREVFLGFLVQVRDGNPGSKDCIVGMFGGEIRGCLSCQVLLSLGEIEGGLN